MAECDRVSYSGCVGRDAVERIAMQTLSLSHNDGTGRSAFGESALPYAGRQAGFSRWWFNLELTWLSGTLCA